MEDHRISVETRNVDILLSHGSQISGDMFLQLYGTNSYGPQTVEEILNGENTFIPLRHNGKVQLLNINHIATLSCDAAGELNDLQRLGESYTVSVETVAATYEGLQVFVNLPTGHQRIKDFLNQPKSFLLFINGEKSLYINRDMIVRVSD